MAKFSLHHHILIYIFFSIVHPVLMLVSICMSQPLNDNLYASFAMRYLCSIGLLDSTLRGFSNLNFGTLKQFIIITSRYTIP
jgi:hypothetical protein